MSQAQSFQARLESRGPKGAWVKITIPFLVEEVFGSRAQVKVRGTMNGFSFRNSLMPNGDGTHSMHVSKELQAGAGVIAGDVVDVEMLLDTAERVVTLPLELDAVLRKNKRALALFEKLSFSHRKEYADWVAGAKKEETRQSRAAKAVEMVLAGQRQR